MFGGGYMLTEFYMNGLLWHVRFVNPSDPILIDRTNVMTVAVTDPDTMTIYIADNLRGSFLNRVFIHELGHCAMFAYNLLPQLHAMVKKRYWIDAEEFCCNLLANYGMEVFGIAYSVLGDEAIRIVPYQMERLVS